MKIYKGWLVSWLICFVAYFISLYGIWKIILSPVETGKIITCIMLVIIAGCFALVGIFGLFKGDAYYKYEDYPMSDFEVKLYDNRITIALDNHVWVFTDSREKIAKLETIKARLSYNIKKEFIGWKLTPYAGKL